MATAGASDVVRRYFETFQDGGLEEAVAFWDPEIEWRAVEGPVDDVGVVRGHDAMKRYYAEWVETMDDLRADIEVVFEGETGVALLVRNSGRGRASGVPASGLYYLACLVREGRIVIGREFASREEAISSARDLDRPAREASS